jgi:ferric-dicitrate binding protein FerR (iron transport regulator)
MKRDDEEAVALLRRLGARPVPELTAEMEAPLIARLSASIERSLIDLEVERPRRRSRFRIIAIIAVAAALLLALGFVWRGNGAEPAPAASVPTVKAVVGQLFVVHEDGERELARPGLGVRDHDELSTAKDTLAELFLVSRAMVEVGADSLLQLEPLFKNSGNECITLTRGRVSLKVPKLAQGHHLSVRTPDALVTVRGTRFSVSVQPLDGESLTLVEVTEGRVGVTTGAETLELGPGQRWSSAGAKTRPPPPPPTAVPSSSAAAGRAVPAIASPLSTARAARSTVQAFPALGSASAAPPASRAPGSLDTTLAAENQAYQQAMRRAHGSHPAQAAAEFEAFAREHPRSPLVENARVERFRLLQRLGERDLAARAARRYLSDYPNGFARSEARAIALYGLTDSP